MASPLCKIIGYEFLFACRKISNISPGLIEVWKNCLEDLNSGCLYTGLTFRGRGDT